MVVHKNKLLQKLKTNLFETFTNKWNIFSIIVLFFITLFNIIWFDDRVNFGFSQEVVLPVMILFLIGLFFMEMFKEELKNKKRFKKGNIFNIVIFVITLLLASLVQLSLLTAPVPDSIIKILLVFYVFLYVVVSLVSFLAGKFLIK